MLRLLAKLLKALNAEGSPIQISLGFVAGMIVGLTPFLSLHNFLIIFFVFIFRVNLSSFFLMFGVFSGIAYVFDPFMNQLGESLLTSPALEKFWSNLYDSDAWRLTHFNNTLTLGSLVTAFVLALPMLLLSNFLVKNYREHVLAWVRKTKIMKFFKARKFYQIYKSLPLGSGP